MLNNGLTKAYKLRVAVEIKKNWMSLACPRCLYLSTLIVPSCVKISTRTEIYPYLCRNQSVDKKSHSLSTGSFPALIHRKIATFALFPTVWHYYQFQFSHKSTKSVKMRGNIRKWCVYAGTMTGTQASWYLYLRHAVSSGSRIKLYTFFTRKHSIRKLK